ncbi:hypothetical protein SNK04_014431 [Fusarium graminearum]
MVILIFMASPFSRWDRCRRRGIPAGAGPVRAGNSGGPDHEPGEVAQQAVAGEAGGEVGAVAAAEEGQEAHQAAALAISARRFATALAGSPENPAGDSCRFTNPGITAHHICRPSGWCRPRK